MYGVYTKISTRIFYWQSTLAHNRDLKYSLRNTVGPCQGKKLENKKEQCKTDTRQYKYLLYENFTKIRRFPLQKCL